MPGSGDGCFHAGDQFGADGGVAGGLPGVEADHEAVVGVDVDFRDLQVVADGLVAALPGQGLLDLGTAGAELLADDVAAASLHERAAVAAEVKPRSATHTTFRQGPFTQIVLAHPEAPFTRMHGFGHYHDTYRKIDGAWRIAGCKLTRIRLDFDD
jgi:hypothetical protein